MKLYLRFFMMVLIFLAISQPAFSEEKNPDASEKAIGIEECEGIRAFFFQDRRIILENTLFHSLKIRLVKLEFGYGELTVWIKNLDIDQKVELLAGTRYYGIYVYNYRGDLKGFLPFWQQDPDFRIRDRNKGNKIKP